MSLSIAGARFQPKDLSTKTKLTASDMAAINFQTNQGITLHQRLTAGARGV